MGYFPYPANLTVYGVISEFWRIWPTWQGGHFHLSRKRRTWAGNVFPISENVSRFLKTRHTLRREWLFPVFRKFNLLGSYLGIFGAFPDLAGRHFDMTGKRYTCPGNVFPISGNVCPISENVGDFVTQRVIPHIPENLSF